MLGEIELSVGEADKLFLPIPGTNFQGAKPGKSALALENFAGARRSSQPTKVDF
jgi:hypothetical protein